MTDIATALTITQAAQALAMSATAIPVFFWARPLTGPRLALFASTLTVLIPGLAYSALLMSEALYYPVAVVAAWALARCLREPTLPRQLVLVAAVGVALATRTQAVGFAAAILVALGVLAFAERSTAPFRRLLPTLVAFGAVGTSGSQTGSRPEGPERHSARTRPWPRRMSTPPPTSPRPSPGRPGPSSS